MLRTIKLSVDQVYIDVGSTLAHTGTSYQASLTTDFTNIVILPLNIVNSTTSLLSHIFDYNLLPNQPLYVRTMYHFNNGTSSSWSNIIELNSSQIGMKTSSTIVSTPSISVNYVYNNVNDVELVATLRDVTIKSGSGNIHSVSWTVESTDGVMLYNLPNSTDILSELRIPITHLNSSDSIVVTAVAHTDTNTNSNIARSMSTINNTNTLYFVATIKDTLYRNSNNSILITEHSEPYTTIDVRILLLDGSIERLYENLDTYIPTFDVGNLSIGNYYIVEVRGHSGSGNPSPWVEIYRGGVSDRSVRTYSPTIGYNTTTGFGGYIDFNGLSSQTIQADNDNVFYLAVPETTTLAAYKSTLGAIYKTGGIFDLGVGNLFTIPNINYLRLPDGNYMLDHNISLDNGNIEVAKFTKLNYNHTTKALQVTSEFIRSDERYGSGRVSGSVVTNDNKIYYVPGEIFDVNNNQLDLELRIFDILTNTIIDNIPLPVTGLKENVSLTEDSGGNIYMFGGTTGPVRNNIHNELVRDVLNSDIWKFDKITKTWTNIFTVTLVNTNSYRYRMQTLHNGDIFIIDVTPNILDGGVRISYIYNVITNTITTQIPNNPTTEHIGITVELSNGDIMQMSSTSDIVESLSFLTTTISGVSTTNSIVPASQQVLDLIVPVGEIVYVRDPYRYNSIVIEGTSLTNTGTLVYVTNDTSINYYYNDLLITRNTTIPAPVIGVTPFQYNRVVVLNDAKLILL